MITTDNINRVFPNSLQSLDQLEAEFPSRELDDDAAFTRVTGSPNSQDLYSIMQVLGCERVMERISIFEALSIEQLGGRK